MVKRKRQNQAQRVRHIVDIEQLRNERQARREAAEHREGRAAAWHAPIFTRRGGNRPHSLYFIALACLFLAAALLVMSMAVFSVRQVQVFGETDFTPEQLVQLSGVTNTNNLFMLDPADVATNIQREPLLAVEQIKKVYPHTLQITVRQRQPIAAVDYMGNHIIIDSDCVVVDVRADLPPGDYPRVAGMQITEYAKGECLTVEQSLQIEQLRQLLACLEKYECLPDITLITIGDPQSYTLTTTRSVLVDLGKPVDFDKKIAWLPSTLQELNARNVTGGTLYLTTGKDPSYSAGSTSVPDIDTPQPGDTESAGASPSPTPTAQGTQAPATDQPLSDDLLN